MYLKSLELHGFKSFPDKIKLNFDKGLTAVVGPNGSGKSNIGDSVRWVLGEQSTKTLRGNKMEDVIFSGTVGRRPTGFASVTLVIDNSEGTLADYGDEVSVTRKLYRSGDSEYRINGKAVRLKDINELFMDTGLGRDGYSIIGQGKIAEIVSAKSSERREIFEEAAGISKFRYRKTEAERRLAQAQEKMERVQDIFSELQNQLNPLRLQSQKAEKFLVLAQEEKKLEVSVWVQQLADLQQKLKMLEEKLLISQTEYENAERDMTDEEEKMQNCYQNMQAYSVEVEEAHALVRKLRSQTAQAQSDIAVWKNDIVHSQEALQLSQTRHEQDLQEQSLRLEQMHQAETHAAEMRRLFADTQKALQTAEQAFYEIEHVFVAEDKNSRQADEKLHQLYLERSELQFSIRSVREKSEQVQTEISALENVIFNHEQMLKEAEAVYEQALSAMQELQKQVSAQEQKLTEYHQTMQTVRQQKLQAEEHFKQLGFQLRDKKQRHRILSDLENHMEGFSGSVKMIMRNVKQGNLKNIFGSVAQLIQVENAFGIAIETALGASVQHLIVADESAAKAGIRFLRDNKAGRATFLPLTTIKGKCIHAQDFKSISGQKGFIAVASDLITCEPAYQQIAENLLGRIIIAENIDDAAAIARSCQFRFRIVTLDGQVIHAGGSFTGGSVQKTGGMLTRKTELHVLQEEIQRLSAQCQVSENDTRKLAAQTAQAEQNFETETNLFQEFRQKFLQAQTEAERQAFPVSQYRKQLQEYAERMDNLKQQSAKADDTIAETKLAYQQKLKEIEQTEHYVYDTRSKKDTVQREQKVLLENYSNLKIKLAQAEKDREAAENALLQMQASFQKAQQQQQQYLTESDNYQNIINTKTKAIQEREIFLKETERQIAALEQQSKDAAEKHDRENIKIRRLQESLHKYHKEKERLAAEVTRLSERQSSMIIEKDQIIAKLFETYELTRSEAQDMAAPVENMETARKHLSELKQKIRTLGGVNVDAIEEYKKVSERHRFYAKEMTDIKKSRMELEKMIHGLTEEMCRIFSESFVIINQNFKEIFQDLFGGGRAELTLTEPENILTSGIEISVAPPGKVIKNLISLSGGEQSFVAIAIYFAILRLKPAPFCILDEIDAALDESNVRKYAKYLHHFTDYTQFVLVTHRRSAMEEANVLYGVTMQEDGISRLLKLEQPEDIPEEASHV